MKSIFRAAREGDEGAVSRLLDDADPVLLETVNRRGSRPLMTAAEHGQLRVVKLLVQRGANVNATGYYSRTALHQAADRGHEDVVALLLSYGAQGNIANNFGQTPLMGGGQKGHLGVVQMLLQHVGAEGLEQRDGDGCTALHYAADGGHDDVVASLLSQGAQGNIANNFGTTPLMGACQWGHLGVVPMVLQHVGTQGLDHRDNKGRTALHWAATLGHEEVVAFLLSQGAQGSIATNDGSTPLICAAQHSYLGVVQMLLQYVGAEGLDKRDVHGWTALHYAVTGVLEDEADVIFNGAGAEVVRMLLLAGADPIIMDNEGRTPLTLAHDGPSEEDMEWLMVGPQREFEEEYAKCVAVFQWWEGELERRYLFQRARCLHDASMTQRDQPTSQVPTYLEARVAAGHAVPRVEVVLSQSEEQQGEEEERHAMLAYVVKALNQELLTELLEGFHTPKGEAQG